jgi:hypothetical protein
LRESPFAAEVCANAERLGRAQHECPLDLSLRTAYRDRIEVHAPARQGQGARRFLRLDPLPVEQRHVDVRKPERGRLEAEAGRQETGRLFGLRWAVLEAHRNLRSGETVERHPPDDEATRPGNDTDAPRIDVHSLVVDDDAVDRQGSCKRPAGASHLDPDVLQAAEPSHDEIQACLRVEQAVPQHYRCAGQQEQHHAKDEPAAPHATGPA